MADSKLTPLQYNVPITNEDGTPTPYFIQLLQQLYEEKAITDAAVTNAIIAGAGLTGGGDLAAGPVTLAASVQAILNLLSTTRGVVLYRGASVWSALAPGTAGNVLTTNGAGADPTWSAPAGGGGGAVQQSARMWRLRALYDNNTTSNTWSSAGEVQFKNAGGVVLTAGGTAISGGFFNATFAPSTAFDGVLPAGDSGWLSQPNVTGNGYTSPEVWLGYNNPTAIAPTQVTFYPHANYPLASMRQFSVDFSLDSGITWFAVVRCALAAPVVGTPQTFAIPTFAFP